MMRLPEPQNELRIQWKILMKQAIEALREYYRVQLYLCQEEQQHSSKEEKAAYVTKLKKLTEEFDEKKKKIKADFRSNDKEMDKVIKLYGLH
jgi:deoxyribodipyrimidine photolyase